MSAVERYFRPGEKIFSEGESSRSLYIIKKGTVSVRKNKESQFFEISRVYPNEVLGEISFFDRKSRSAAAVAIDEVILLEIDFIALDKIYQVVPDYFKTIILAMVERLRKANDIIRKLKATPDDEHSDEAGAESGPHSTQNSAIKNNPSANDVLQAAMNVKIPMTVTPPDTKKKPS